MISHPHFLPKLVCNHNTWYSFGLLVEAGYCDHCLLAILGDLELVHTMNHR